MSVRHDVLSRLGLWPIAVVLTVVLTARLGAILFHKEVPRTRVVGGGLVAIALFVVFVRLLGAIGLLGGDVVYGALAIGTAALVMVHRTRTLGIAWRDLVGRDTWPLVPVVVFVVLVTSLAAYWLPVWQWDSVGYHLPFVNFVLQHGSLADVPPDVAYVSTYPHNIESLFVAWRAVLADDRLVDAGQIPLGLFGAATIAVLARELGAKVEHAVSAGILWVALPAVFLQLPTNYIDVACAALLLAAIVFVIAPVTRTNVLLAGLALGLFLGSKPNAPVGTAILLLPLAWRAWKAGERPALAAALALVAVFGLESYLTNLVRHHNPIWPIIVKVGPITLPGTAQMQSLLDSGPNAPRLHGFVLWRVLRSWVTFDAKAAFDMRYGGLGLVFLVALPLAVWRGARRRSLLLLPVVAATFASPDPAVPRYVFAFPGVVLALAAAALPALPVLSLGVRRIAYAGASIASIFGICQVVPGLTGHERPFLAYAAMSAEERQRSIGADGPTHEYEDALARLGPGDGTAFDRSFYLPYLAWPGDLSHPTTRIPDDLDHEGVERILADKHLRLLFVDSLSPVAVAARSRHGEFIELFLCKFETCTVFFRS